MRWTPLTILLAVFAAGGCDADDPHELAAGTKIPNEGPVEVPTTPATGVRLAVADTPRLGRYLADSQGRPLYVLTDPTRTCDDTCAREWPPLKTSQPPAEAGERAVRADLIGTVTRDDGTLQVTYAGRPLHYASGTYQVERLPATVDDEFGQWSLILPEGIPVAR